MFSFNKLKNQRGGKASNYNDEMNYSAYDQVCYLKFSLLNLEGIRRNRNR